MDRPAPGLKLEAITPPRQDILRIWRTLRPVDCAFIQDIIGDMVIATGVASLPDSSASQDGGRGPSRYLRGSQSADPGSFSTAPDTRSAAFDSRRHTPGVFGHPSDTSPAPNVFRGAPPTSLTDVVRLRRPSPLHGTRGHG
ncbi:hypothetical protein CDL15_Pgr015565 [Punica granatum]|uniref:Uncharacterized protein n=1 Tax=Punica granatum TaxID=22663 RepID=A0A218W2U6_PUNGR|nr:hypothetical protein CDL15_Pgr015565 [Punica granatum]